MFNFRRSLAVLSTAFLMGFSVSAMAQDAVDKAEKKSKIKIVYMKDGKKQVIEREFTGEMPEDLRKELEKIQADELSNMELNLQNGVVKSGRAGSPVIMDFRKGSDTDKMLQGVEKQIEIIHGNIENNKEAVEQMAQSIKGSIKIINDDLNLSIISDSAVWNGAEGAPRIMIRTLGGDCKLFKDSLGSHLNLMREGLKNVQIKIKDLAELRELNGLDSLDMSEFSNFNSYVSPNSFIFVPKDGSDTRVKELENNGVKLEKFESKEGNMVYMFQSADGNINRSVSIILSDCKKKDELENKSERNNKRQDLEKNNNNEIKGLSNFNVYPNPNDGNFTINFDVKKKATINVSVTDINGREVYSDKKENFVGNYNQKILLSNTTPGAYIVKIAEGKKVRTQRIVIQ
ncbi:MAG: T9SS C-terminal target domain-containing protein [Cytophagales bacterium]|nr:MAG: T9SS C-terminal target domain-containing protein [Cytophagales bacterium]TAF59398.1 MAG: T9SS C-terminal target domain-containing protein [Cytophagales bacterium]